LQPNWLKRENCPPPPISKTLELEFDASLPLEGKIRSSKQVSTKTLDVGNAKVGVSHEYVVDVAPICKPKYGKVNIFIT
jgi:hypothetical protein